MRGLVFLSFGFPFLVMTTVPSRPIPPVNVTTLRTYHYFFCGLLLKNPHIFLEIWYTNFTVSFSTSATAHPPENHVAHLCTFSRCCASIPLLRGNAGFYRGDFHDQLRLKNSPYRRIRRDFLIWLLLKISTAKISASHARGV